jgi:hypothetical protein
MLLLRQRPGCCRESKLTHRFNGIIGRTVMFDDWIEPGIPKQTSVDLAE